MRLPRSLFSSLTLAALLTACSVDKTTAPAVSVQQACTDIATSLCTKLQACAPSQLTSAYGTLATCVTRSALECPMAAAAPGAATTGRELEGCAQTLAAEPCANLLDFSLPAACVAQGTLGQGARCGSSIQCSGTGAYCKLPSNASCGVCATLQGAEGPCASSSDCASGLLCSVTSSGGFCTAPGYFGATCSTTAPCEATLACIAGACATPLARGSPCSVQDSPQGGCDVLHGDSCASNVCTPLPAAAVGAPCGPFDGGLVACAGATCSATGASASSGTCQPLAADGAACSTTTGPQCQSPALCINGKCTIPDPTQCD